MIRVILFIAIFALSMICEAQVSENRAVSDFTQIHSSTGINVYYTQSSTKSVKVESDDQEKLDKIVTEVNDGKLKIYIKSDKKSKMNSFKVLKVYVSAPNVVEFESDSGSTITFEDEVSSRSKIEIKASSGTNIIGNISAKLVEIEVSSGSNYKGKLVAASVKVDLNSGSNVAISGSADAIELKVNSASNFKGKDFEVKSAEIKANSASNVTITVSEKIKANATSVSKINYYGNPKNVNKSSSSLGEINEK